MSDSEMSARLQTERSSGSEMIPDDRSKGMRRYNDYHREPSCRSFSMAFPLPCSAARRYQRTASA